MNLDGKKIYQKYISTKGQSNVQIAFSKEQHKKKQSNTKIMLKAYRANTQSK